MNPLNLIERWFTHRSIERELKDEKVQNKELREENLTLQTEIHNRDTKIEQLRQENKELNDLLHARPPIVETDFDPRKF